MNKKTNSLYIDIGSDFLEKKLRLADLKVGQIARVIKLNIQDKAIKRHLLDMGITRGVEIKIKKIPPMGDPISVELRGYELCIRKTDLKQIEVEVVNENRTTWKSK